MATEPVENSAQNHIVVCLDCRRIKRDGEWTKETATDVRGISTGYCDRCAKLKRKSLGLR
jgi:hypothetical protein